MQLLEPSQGICREVLTVGANLNDAPTLGPQPLKVRSLMSEPAAREHRELRIVALGPHQRTAHRLDLEREQVVAGEEAGQVAWAEDRCSVDEAHCETVRPRSLALQRRPLPHREPGEPAGIMRISGREAVHRDMVAKVQKVYRNQGVTINDKHSKP